MRKIVAFFIKYPVWANALIVLTLVAGGVSLSNMKRTFFPEQKPRNITVQVPMPGASPEEMEEGVTIKIEEAIEGIVGIEEVSSTSSENISVVSILITTDANIDEVVTEVKNAVDRISGFPENAEKPVVYKEQSISRVAWLALKGQVELRELKQRAEEIEDELRASPVISQVDIYGYPDLEIAIEVSEDALLQYGLTFDEIANAVRLNNRDISAGTIKGEDEELLIRSRVKTLDPDEIGNIVLRSNLDGSKVRLKDIASVREQFSDTPNKSYVNKERNVTLQVNKLMEEDLTEISKYLKEYVEEYNGRYQDLELFVTFDFNSLLSARINMLLRNGRQGLIWVLVVLGIFLSLRLSAWVAFGIPASFLGMFIVGSFFGLTINMLSLFGMILVIGILVDDGIVIAENIYSHFEMGKNPQQAALDGTMEVLSAVFTSVITTMVAFAVLLDIEGWDAAREIAIVGMSCLGFSLLEAFFVLPAHLAHKRVLSKRKPTHIVSRIRKPINKVIDFLRYKAYGGMLKYIVKWRWVSFAVFIVFGMLISGMIKGGIIPQTFWPPIQVDDISIDIAFKPGEREDKTEEFLWRFEEAAWQVRQDFIDEKGDTVIDYVYLNLGNSQTFGETGAHTGSVNVNLTLEGKDISSYEIMDRIRDKIGEVPEAEKFSIGGVQRFGKPVSLELNGKNIKELEEATLFIKDQLASIDAIKNITDNSSVGKREIEIRLKPKAYFLGLNHAAITRQIRQGFFGEEIQRLQIGPDEVRVWVRYPESGRSSIGQMENIRIKDPNGIEYPLSELVDYSITRGVTSIRRFNNQRQIRVDADFKDPNTAATPIMEKIRTDIVPVALGKYPTINIDYGGQSRSSQKVDKSLQNNGIIAAFVILIFLTLNFRNFEQVLLILPFVYLSYYCAQLGHLIEGLPFSRLSMFGFIALAGVIINDSVVFIDMYNRKLRAGFGVIEAIHETGMSRFRPIVLTSITTVAGLMPLIRETDFQAQFIIPMSVSIAYGVLFGTLLILLFLPALLLVLNDVKRAIKGLWDWKLPDAEVVEPAIREKNRLKEFDVS